MLLNFYSHRHLIAQLVRREVLTRYRGSMLGLFWSLLSPLMLLAVYTFVFSIVFKARWQVGGAGAEESKLMFALLLFAGLIVHGFIAEVLLKAPILITSNVSYVKKVVFPLEILAIVSVCEALFHAMVSFLVLVVAISIFSFTGLSITAFFAPLVLLPLIPLALGIAWFLASIGVFVRDVGQTTGLMSALLMFLSPVFFPVAALPKDIQPLILLNPLTFIIEQLRDVLVWGRSPDWPGLALYFVCVICFAVLGYSWFQKTRQGFADVL
jgi:lipopolysaccharide transport system permease protein